MPNLTAMVKQCVEEIVAHRNKEESARYKKTIDFIRSKLLDRFDKAGAKCSELLAKITDIDFISERDCNVAAYHNWLRDERAFRYAMEVLSAALICPPVKETENWDSDIYSLVAKVACDFADIARADEKAQATKRSLVKRARQRAAAKKSITRK
jgi:hypothetical protein